MLTSLTRVFVSIRATFGCGFSCVNAYFSLSSFWSGTVCVRACVCACARACFPSHEWTDRVFPRESSFTSLRKKTRRMDGGRAGRRRWMEVKVGGGVLSESVSPSLTVPYPPSPLIQLGTARKGSQRAAGEFIEILPRFQSKFRGDRCCY